MNKQDDFEIVCSLAQDFDTSLNDIDSFLALVEDEVRSSSALTSLQALRWMLQDESNQRYYLFKESAIESGVEAFDCPELKPILNFDL